MSKLLITILLTPILLSAQKSELRKDEKTQIAILGMFHLGGTNDMTAVKIKNLHGSQRQSEIKVVVDKLKKFNPTKILVEYPVEGDSALFDKYTRFLNGKDTLKSSETEQIGFRLAKDLGHNKLYAIDHKMDMPMENLIAYCQQHGRMGEFQELIKSVSAFAQSESIKLEGEVLHDFLAYMNTDRYDKIFHKLYLNDILSFGNANNEAGIQYTLNWYERNLNIFKNITEVIGNTNERILIIIGSNHRAGLREFIANRDDIDFIEIGHYLK